MKGLEFPPAAVALGPAELIEEVSEGKITGEEDRYSHTDLSDFAANVDGSRKLFELLTPSLQAKDATLTSEITAGFAAVEKSLSEYANPDGSFDLYTALQADDKTRMQAELADLSEKLAASPACSASRADRYARRPPHRSTPGQAWAAGLPRVGGARVGRPRRGRAGRLHLRRGERAGPGPPGAVPR
jgi:hypothetical protein